MVYQSQRKPRAKQAEALKILWRRKYFGLLMAMRTGKTKVGVDDFGQMVAEDLVDDLLVVAPAAVYETWEEAVKADLDKKLLSRTRIYVWRADRNTKKDQAALESFMAHPGPRVLIVNIEAISSVERARTLCQEFLSQRRSDFIVDESTTIRNYRAERAAFIIDDLGPRAAYRRILTGLVTPRSPLDAFGQFEFLSPEILSTHPRNSIARRYKAFEKKYAITRKMDTRKENEDGTKSGHVFRIVVGYKEVPDLAAKINANSFRVRLKDCYDLPEKMRARRSIPLHPEQRRVYEEIKKNAFTQLENEAFVTVTMVIVQMLRLHQVLCGHVVDEVGEMHEVPELRTQELLNLLEEYDGKAVIWCNYDYNIRKISEALEKEYGKGSVARFWGGNKKTREAEEKEFQTNPKCRFMVSTEAAGQRGREWSIGNLVVYYSNSPDLEQRSQSEERTQAVGKKEPVLYVDFVAEGTVDEKYIDILNQKIKLSAAISGDDFREWLI